MTNSIISTLLHAHRSSISSEVIVFSEENYKIGSLHFINGEIRAVYASDYQGEEALDYLYREEWSGTNFNYEVLDGLSLYVENVKEEIFTKIIFALFEKQKQRKVARNFMQTLGDQSVYWQ